MGSRLARSISIFVAACLGLLPLTMGLAQSTSRLVLGYYVPYDATSWTSLQAHAGELDIIATQTVGIDACGGISSQDDQTLKRFAREHGARLVPSLFTASAWLDHQVLTDDGARTAALQSIVDYVTAEGYDGFDVDIEGIDPDDRAAFNDFVAELGPMLHARGKLLTLAVPAKERDATTGWAGAFDYAALGGAADLVTIMAYEYRGPFSGPGSVAPYDWVDRVAAFATQQMPADKVLLGLAFYGYDWNTSAGGTLALGYPEAVALAGRVEAEPAFDAEQQSVTFSYTADAAQRLAPQVVRPVLNHTVTRRTPPACGVEPPPPPTLAPRRPPPPAGTPQDHQVWLENSTSAAARLGLADAYAVRGVATWRLGLEDPNVWPLFDDWRAGRVRASGE